MTAFTEAWGGGCGRIRKLSPSARLVCATLTFASCSIVPLNDPGCVALLLGVLMGWTAWCGIPLRRLGSVLCFALCLFLPLLLLAPVARLQAEAGSWSEAFRVPLAIVLRGISCVVVCAAAMAALELSELGQGLAGLPLPRTLMALVVQIAHQAALLTDESSRLAAALRLRGVPASGAALRLRCLFALPVLWLVRLLMRAERVSAAMEVRGFEGMPRRDHAAGVSVFDRSAMAVALVVLGAALVLRWGVK